MKSVLISGGAGFVGSHLLEELVKNKDYMITVIDDFSTGKWENIEPYLPLITVLKARIQDVNMPFQFDLIWHLGAKANTREKGLKDFEDNVMATEAVVKMLKPDGRIFFSSSCAVYGDQTFVTENSPFQPISPYGYSKWMNELTIKDNCKNFTIFRFSNVFGERQDGACEMGLIGVIENSLKNNKTMRVFNQGDNFRDYIYVKDVVKALTTIKEDSIFQVGSCKVYNTGHLVRLSGVKWKYGSIYKGLANNEVQKIKLDNNKLKARCWKPTLSVITYIKGLKK